MAAGWLLALLALIGLIAIIMSAVLAFRTEDIWFDQFWLEVAKGGVQVVAVGVLGGALAATWQIISANREAKLQQNAKIRDELASLVDLYNEVKAIRRTLRSLGLDLKTYPDDEQTTVARAGLLTRKQARGFAEQMLALSLVQLQFEAKVRQFGQTNFLGRDTETVVEMLGSIESHLNKVLDLWEQRGWTICEGNPIAEVSDGLNKLFRVREHLRPSVSEPLREITRLMNKNVFGEASKRTQTVFMKLSEREGQ